MNSRNIFTRRFLVGFLILFILTAVNVGLFFYVRAGVGPKWNYIEKNDGTVIFGKVTLLDGGFLQIQNAYGLAYTDHLQGTITGQEFRVESLNQQTVTVKRQEGLDDVRFGPNEITQWGDVPADSAVGKRIIGLMEASSG